MAGETTTARKDKGVLTTPKIKFLRWAGAGDYLDFNFYIV